MISISCQERRHRACDEALEVFAAAAGRTVLDSPVPFTTPAAVVVGATGQQPLSV